MTSVKRNIVRLDGEHSRSCQVLVEFGKGPSWDTAVPFYDYWKGGGGDSGGYAQDTEQENRQHTIFCSVIVQASSIHLGLNNGLIGTFAAASGVHM